MSRISNTAVPQEYGRSREAVLKGEIPVPETISMQMNRIDREDNSVPSGLLTVVPPPGFYYSSGLRSSS